MSQVNSSFNSNTDVLLGNEINTNLKLMQSRETFITKKRSNQQCKEEVAKTVVLKDYSNY